METPLPNDTFSFSIVNYQCAAFTSILYYIYPPLWTLVTDFAHQHMDDGAHQHMDDGTHQHMDDGTHQHMDDDTHQHMDDGTSFWSLLIQHVHS